MIAPALASLRALYQRRAVRADALRAARVLSLLAEPNALAHLNTSLTETVRLLTLLHFLLPSQFSLDIITHLQMLL